jgi:aryl-alcohol dehydrogenase-like predicted oxidoreductase
LANGFLAGKYTKDSVFPVGDIRHQWPSKYQAQLVNQVESFKKSLGESPLTPTQAALKFVLAQPAVSVVIPGCKTADQARENFKTSDLTLEVSFRS